METKKEKFDPASLPKEEQEAVIEYYLGVNPKYFIYHGLTISVDTWALFRDNPKYVFNGFKPHLKELGIETE